MNRTTGIIAAAGLLLALSTGASLAAGRTISAQEKQASDQQVSTGLGQEQAALGARQGGNEAGALTDLQSALAAMRQALPIYHGYRGHSMGITNHIIKELSNPVQPKNPAKKLARLEGQLSTAITDAQTALQNSSTTITEEDRERPGAL